MDRGSLRFRIWPDERNNFATVKNERFLLNLLCPLNESNHDSARIHSGCMNELVSDPPKR